MTIQTTDNKYGVSKWIVDPILGRGTHTNIAAAIASASSGDDIFIRPGTYPENLTMKAGVNLTAFSGDSTTSNVTIIGKITYSAAGLISISNITLQTNGDFFLVVSGSSASIVNLNNCYLNCINSTGISCTSSNVSCLINIINCHGDIGANSIALYASSTTGNIFVERTIITNSGSSTTANSNSAGGINIKWSNFNNPCTCTSTGVIGCFYSTIECILLNTTALTLNGGGSNAVRVSEITSGTASAISVGTSANIANCIINSSNINAITGAGIINYTDIYFAGSSNTINTTTQSPFYSVNGISRSTLQPAFLVYPSVNIPNVTGDGTPYIIAWDTKVFDQNNNFASNTFTAPITGKYLLSTIVTCENIGAGHIVGEVAIITSARIYKVNRGNYALIRDTVANALSWGASVLANMNAGDTATVRLIVSASTKTITLSGGSGTSTFSGYLVC